MSSPGSCSRCSRTPALLSPNGLCPVCAATSAPAETAPDRAPPAPAFVDLPVTDLPPVPASEGPTAAEPVGAPPAECGVLPESPPGLELLRRLGGGGMGDVYLARECPSERLVAVKFLRRPEHPSAYQRFVTELQVLADLKHPNIVGVFTSDFLRASPFFTMEYLDGGSLADVLKPKPGTTRPDPLAPADAVPIIRGVGTAVAAAHARGIVHRDLKPSNVLLGTNGALKVADFGLAKRLGDGNSFTGTADTLGTPGYMPPEQVSRANGEIDGRADVYGLGATLYHLLTGRAPFVGAHPFEVIAQVLAYAPVPPRALRPEIPLGLEAVVLKCLAKDPAERYPTVSAFLADLDRCEAGQEPVAPARTRARRVREWIDRRRRGAAAATLAPVIVLIAFTLGAMFQTQPPVPPEQAPPPADPLAEVQRELTARRQVVLVPGTGKPAWHEWPIGAPALGTSPTGDGTCSFEALEFALLELCPDPMTDRYRLRAELRHLQSKTGGDEVSALGVYFARSGLVGANGVRGQAFFAVTFSELPRLKVPPGKCAQFRRAALIQQPHRNIDLAHGGIRAVPFAQADQMPGPWRPIEIQVTPDGVQAFWPNAEGQMVPFADLSAAAVRAEYAKHEQKFAPLPAGHGLKVPAWRPRMPLGIWAHRAAVDVRNVVLTPLN
ncbi:MAG TPA: serine/threonine-protein kinase [Gemmata sp.]